MDAPLGDKDELGHRIRMFTAGNPDVNSRLHMFASSVLVSLAEGQLGRMSMDLSPQDVSQWTLFRLLDSPVHQGKLEDALAVIMRLIPALKGVLQLKAICSAAIVNFCLRVRVLLLPRFGIPNDLAALSRGVPYDVDGGEGRLHV